LKLEIGGIKVDFICDSRKWPGFLRKNYAPYIVSGKSRADALVRLSELQKGGGRFSVKAGPRGPAISREDFRSRARPASGETLLESAFNKYSFDSWFRIFITLLALQKRSILVHASGISRRGKAFVFPGRSGSGKSTMIKKLGRNGALSDELVLLNLKGKKVYASSTPFWGELKMDRSHKRRTSALKGMYFLKKGACTAARGLDRGEALSRLLSAVLFFSKETRGVKKLFSLCGRICRAARSYEFTFPLNAVGKELYADLQKTR
jgi:hypothetical protein